MLPLIQPSPRSSAEARLPARLSPGLDRAQAEVILWAGHAAAGRIGEGSSPRDPAAGGKFGCASLQAILGPRRTGNIR